MLYCAVTVRLEVTLVKAVSQPVKVQPGLAVVVGAVAFPP